jgi:chitinase
LQADITIAEWDIQQTYPQNANYPVDPIDDPNYDGTQTVGVPTFEASVTATGEVALHLKPEVTFGVVFDSRWKVDPCSVSLVLDGYIIFHAEAMLSTSSDNSCPFTYGIDAGSNLYAQLASPSLCGWGGQQQIPIAAVPRKQITPDVCPATTTTLSRRGMGLEPDYVLNETDRRRYPDTELVSPLGAAYIPDLLKRTDTFTLGPIITIPSGFLSCPSDTNAEDNSCPLCDSSGNSGSLFKRQDGGDTSGSSEMACPWTPAPEDLSCSDSTVAKRAQRTKEITLSWAGTFDYSYYPSCSAGDLSSMSAIPKV